MYIFDVKKATATAKSVHAINSGTKCAKGFTVSIHKSFSFDPLPFFTQCVMSLNLQISLAANIRVQNKNNFTLFDELMIMTRVMIDTSLFNGI